MKRILAAAFGAAALALASSPAFPANVPDSQFLQTVIGINLAEISVGQLAQKNGGGDAARQFGAMLVDDHTAGNKAAVALAQAEGVVVPNQPSTEDQATYQKLAALKGPAFDENFAAAMVAGHQGAIALFTAKINDASANPDVVAFAKSTLPTLQKHLEMAQQLASTSNTTGMISSPPNLQEKPRS